MRIRLSVRAALTATLMTTLATSLSACGQRGALYIPGKPGDPYFDRQHRGGSGTTGANPIPVTAPNSTVPASSDSVPGSVPGSMPGLPSTPRPKREDGTDS